MSSFFQNSFHESDTDEDVDGNSKKLCWRAEAAAIIQDVQDHVNLIEISENLNNQPNCIYLNVRILEGDTYCILASNKGFCILSRTFDTIDENYVDSLNNDNCSETSDDENGEQRRVYYETIYSLLDRISPLYVKSFASNLCTKLHLLQESI